MAEEFTAQFHHHDHNHRSLEDVFKMSEWQKNYRRMMKIYREAFLNFLPAEK